MSPRSPKRAGLAFASVSLLRRYLDERRLTSVDLAEFFLERLTKLGPRYNALAELTPELALKHAREADRRLAEGRDLTPLTGIPYGAKDLLATAGIPTRWGSPAHRDQVFDFDATAVRRLAEAGAVLVGKLAMVEIAGGGGYDYPSASLHGPGLNPWDTARWSGGSSSGSGSSVAAGLVPFALGSETWGSIITPSAFCGITGLRPTRGLVSLNGAMELSWQMDKVGPMARSARDCLIVLEAIAGPDPGDPLSRPAPAGKRPGRRATTLGVVDSGLDYDSPAGKAFAAALEVLRSCGYQTAPVALPDRQLAPTARTLLNGDVAAAHEELIRSGRVAQLVDEGQKQRLTESLASPSAIEYSRALRERASIEGEVMALFEQVDVLIAPSLRVEAPPVDEPLSKMQASAGGVSVLGALLGVPEITAPMGSGDAGMPLGLSFVGPHFSERMLAGVATAFQSRTTWHRRRPPVARA
jgi:aspartyl-tRNA(Asn)/glutamyl-tRNA(Gln) amidotransferase subunit A